MEKLTPPYSLANYGADTPFLMEIELLKIELESNKGYVLE